MTVYKGTGGKLLGPIISKASNHSTDRQILLHRTFVLLLTFVLYATYRLSRRPLSIVKSVFHNEKCIAQLVNETVHFKHELLHQNQTANLSLSERNCGWAPFDGADGKELLGVLDTCFLFMYMFGTYGNGYIADRSNIRYFLSISLTACGFISIAFGMARTFEIHSLWFFLGVQALAGYASASMPAMISVVGQWFGSAKKGLIFGIWNWHGSVGTILGSIIAGAFVETNWGMSFIVPGLICISMAGVVLIFLIPKPADVGLEVHYNNQQNTQQQKPAKQFNEAHLRDNTFPPKGFEIPQEEKAISFWNALMIPGVIEFSIAQFFTKLVNYTFLYWLPFFLKNAAKLSSSASAYASIVFDIGGCVGSMAAGLMADRTGTSAITCIVFLVLSIPSLYSLNLFTGKSMLINYSLQFLTGGLINGPFCLIMSTVSANLACKVPSKSAMATVSGIINGTGSIGAAIGPLLAGFVSKHGWKNVFYMAIGSVLCAAISLLRIGYQELKHLRGNNDTKDKTKDMEKY